MKNRSFLRTCVWLLVLGGLPAVAGCKEDPPPPAPDTPGATGSTRAKDPGGATARTQIPRVSPESTKLFRADACYYGALGLRYARDSYLASLDGAEPGPGKIPSFGEYEEGRAGRPGKDEKAPEKAPEKGAPEKGKDDKGGDDKVKTRNPVVPPLPFNRHVRSCGILKTLKKPEAAKLDPAALEFEKYISKLNRAVSDAHRYYSRETYDKDEFKRGKELHKELTEGFAELDKQLAAFGAAVEEWRAPVKAPDTLDAAGEAGAAAVAEARALVAMLLGDKVEQAAAQAQLDKVTAAATKVKDMGKEDAQAAHPRVLGPSLDKLAEVAKKATDGIKDGKVEGKLASELALAYANVAEAHHRALAQMLRRGAKGDGPAQPLRMLNPRVHGERPTAEEGANPAKDEPQPDPHEDH